MESTALREQLRTLVDQLIEKHGGVNDVHVETLNAELRRNESNF